MTNSEKHRSLELFPEPKNIEDMMIYILRIETAIGPSGILNIQQIFNDCNFEFPFNNEDEAIQYYENWHWIKLKNDIIEDNKSQLQKWIDNIKRFIHL